MLTTLTRSRALHLLFLALPFLAVIAAWRGLSHDFGVYQAFDESIHFQIVGWVAHMWPHPMLSGYAAWSGPFVYWLLATLALPFGASLTATRLIVAVLSWATCVVAYVIFRDRLGARPRDALALSLLLALSPFFFGESFRVLTDNPTWLFVMLAIERLLAFVQNPRFGRFVAFVVLAAAATTMRQTAIWLFLPALLALFATPLPRNRQLAGAAILVLGMAPLAALMFLWGGLLPSGAAVSFEAVPRVRNVLLSLAVLGLYGLLLIPRGELRTALPRLGRRGRLAAGCAAALSLAVLGLGALSSLGGRDPQGMGLLARTTDLYPRLGGTSVLWWLLVPLGATALVVFICTRSSRPTDRVLAWALAAVLLSAAANVTWYQRYVDFPVLLLVAALAVSAGVGLRWLDRLRWIALAGVSVAWTVMYVLAYMHPS